MTSEEVPKVTNGRALMTDRDRRQIAREGDVEDNEHYQAVSRVRRRIRENFGEDIALLTKHHQGLLQEIQDISCDLQESSD